MPGLRKRKIQRSLVKVKELPKKTKNKRIRNDFYGPNNEGKFFISQAETISKLHNLDTTNIIKEMKKSDFKNLIKVFNQKFGYITNYELET